MTTTDRKTGSIARLITNRVFGFIHCPDDARDYFFHQAHLDGCTYGQLEEGDLMSFVVADGPKGLEAQEVQLVQHDPPKGHETREQLGNSTPKSRRPRR